MQRKRKDDLEDNETTALQRRREHRYHLQQLAKGPQAKVKSQVFRRDMLQSLSQFFIFFCKKKKKTHV